MKPLVPGSGVPAIVDADGCWLWTGSKDRDGYGLMRTKQGTRRVHRVSFEQATGETLMPKDEVDHRCRKRACFRPGCLEKVDRLENERRKPGRRPGASRWGKYRSQLAGKVA